MWTLSKPPRPVLNRRQYMSGLIFACASGWEKGYDDTGLGNTAPEDITYMHGLLEDSNDGTYISNYLGKGSYTGTSLDSTTYQNAAGKYTFAANSPVSAFFSGRITVGAGGRIALGNRANLSLGVGFSLGTSGGMWRATVADGAAVVVLDDPTGYTVNTPYVVGMVYDVQNLYLWVNGKMVASVAATLSIATSNQIALHGSTVNTNNFNGDINSAAVWDVALPNQMMEALYKDPYLLWRPEPVNYGRVEGAPPTPGRDNTCCPCCQQSLLFCAYSDAA